MEHLLPPGALLFDGNKAASWKKFKQRWENYAIATGLKTKEPTVQTATFLHVIGDEALERYNNFKWSEGENRSDLAAIMEQFEKYCIPRKNVTFERHLFNTRFQQEGESIDSYVKALQTLAQNCEFGDLNDSLIRDRIVAGIRNERIKERLLEKANLTLESAIEITRASEASKLQIRSFKTEEHESPNALSAEVETVKTKTRIPRNGPHRYPKQNETRKADTQRDVNTCKRCGRSHPPRKCRAWGNSCYKCKGRNHFANVCLKRNGPKNIATVEEYESEDGEEFFIGQVTCKDMESQADDWEEQIIINGQSVKFKLDTGAQCNILPKSWYDRVSDEPLEKSNVKLVSYTKNKINPLGQKSIVGYVRGTRYRFVVQIVPDNFEAVIGQRDCVRMRLVTKLVHTVNERSPREDERGSAKHTTMLDEYKDVFVGLGSLPGQYHIVIDPTVQPVVHPPRRVPYALRGKLKDELNKMERIGIIRKVPDNEPSDWVNSLVLVNKPNGELRVCIDPKDLNKAIKREHYPLPTVEEIAAKVEGAQYFSALDAKKAFYQVRLDEESSKLLTFITPYGRYRYLRMPMGIKSAPEIYQKKIQEVYSGLEGVEVVMDDTIIWGKTEKEHDDRLRSVLERVRKNGVKLNSQKCKIKEGEIKYLGHRFTREGLKVNEERVKAIKEMPRPTDKKGLQRFLGMLNYVSKFIPNMSELTSSLRELLLKDVDWQWTADHEAAYQRLVKKLAKAPVLAYYDPKKNLTLQVDASSKGLGATLLQDDRPVAYASRSLTPCQQNYAQIEKELLAILFGCTKFDEYIVGRDTKIESDHKPLEMIFKKPLHAAPLRLQKMLVQLQRYPGIEIHYKKGKEMYFADALSRASLRDDPRKMEEFEINVLNVVPMSPSKLNQFTEATKNDPELAALTKIIKQGWPETKESLDMASQRYWNYRDEMSIIEGLVFKGSKIVIPKQLRKEMLEKLHEAHLGVVKTKQRARDVLFWPNMNAEVENMIKSCSTCQTYQRNNATQPLKPHHIPSRPWSKVGTDLFHYKGQDYILCVDYHSKYPEMIRLDTLSSMSAIRALKSIFSRHGIPDIVISDNGPQYRSIHFQKFSEDWGFEHQTSSPRYPRSNGQAERTVQTLKNMLKKAADPYLALLEYRNTPLNEVGRSPAQLLMGRRLKSTIPTSEVLLQPSAHEDAVPRLRLRQQKQKYFHDRNGFKTLPDLKAKEEVRVKLDGEHWQPAEVVAKLPYDSYEIRTPQGASYRRNRSHLKKNYRSETPAWNHETPENRTEDPPVGRSPRASKEPIEEPGHPPTLDECPVPAANTPDRPYQTRSGRTIKKPSKLNL